MGTMSMTKIFPLRKKSLTLCTKTLLVLCSIIQIVVVCICMYIYTSMSNTSSIEHDKDIT